MSARIIQGNRVEPTSLPLVIRHDARLPSRRYQLRRMPDVGYIPTLRPMDSPHFANSGAAGSVRDPPTRMVADPAFGERANRSRIRNLALCSCDFEFPAQQPSISAIS